MSMHSKIATANRVDNLREALLLAGIVATACAWSFQMTSFLHAKELVFCVFMALMLVPALFHLTLTAQGLLAQQAVMTFYALLVIATTLTQGRSYWHCMPFIRVVLLWCGLFVVADLFTRDRLPRIHLAIVVSGGAVGLLAALQYAGLINGLFPVFPEYTQPAYSVFGNQDLLGGYTTVCLALGVSMLLQGLTVHPNNDSSAHFVPRRAASQRFLLCVSLLCCVAGLVVSMSRSAWLAAAVGVAVAVPWRRLAGRMALKGAWKKHALLMLLALVATLPLLAVMPQIQDRITGTFQEGDTGYHVRRWLWAGAWEMVCERPLTGVGWGNYPMASPLFLGGVLWKPGGEDYPHNELFADNAHCEPLQFLAENGLVGVGVLILVGLLWFYGIRRQAIAPAARAAWGALAALLVFSLFNAAFKSLPHAWAGLLLLLGPWDEMENRTRPTWWVVVYYKGLILVSVSFMVLTYSQFVFVPSHCLRMAENAHMAGDPAAESLYQRVFSARLIPPQAREDYAILLHDQGRHGEALEQLEKAGWNLDTGRVHLLRAECLLALDRREEAFSAAAECVFRWPGNARAWELVTATATEDERDKWLTRRARWLGY